MVRMLRMYNRTLVEWGMDMGQMGMGQWGIISGGKMEKNQVVSNASPKGIS